MSAVVDETAFRSSLERWVGSERGEPRHQRRRTSERIDHEVRLDLPALTGTSPSDPNMVSRVGRSHEIDDSGAGQHVDVGLIVHCSPKCELEEWPASPDRDERSILRRRVPRQELVLTILQRSETENGVEDIGCVLQEHAPGEAKEVVRLAKVSDAGASPFIELRVRVPVINRQPIALEHNHAPPASCEDERGGQAG